MYTRPDVNKQNRLAEGDIFQKHLNVAWYYLPYLVCVSKSEYLLVPLLYTW